MHVSGLARVTASYEHIDPARVGNERRVLVSELSGRSNIVALTTKHNLQKDQKLMDRILAKVVSKEHAGYQFEGRRLLRSPGQGVLGDVPAPLRAAQLPREHRDRVRRPDHLRGHGQDPRGDLVRHEVAEGDGPVNALDAAMRKALNGSFPALRSMQLVDYKVRVINSEAGTAAGVRVVIESRDKNDVWATVGVSENIIEASWIALVDSYEYKLCKEEEPQEHHETVAKEAAAV